MTITIVGGGNPSGPTFPVQRSVRFRSSASAYLSRTNPAAGNLQRWTISFWHKRSTLSYSGNQNLISCYTGISSNTELRFNSSDQLTYFFTNAAVAFVTSAVYRDPSAWYHIVLVWDSANATAALRCRLYVNGVEVTAMATDNRSSISSNNSGWNNTTAQNIMTGNGAYVDGYLTEVNFIDGQALTPTSFGAYNSYGVWSPAKYSGTYGTNGFYLNFQDNSAATAAAIGKDNSGNGNNWTPNNISLTAGNTYDSMTDVPTLTSPTTSNYPVMNPLIPSASSFITSGNLNIAGLGVTNQVQSTFAVTSGKWYWEIELTNDGAYAIVGVSSQADLTSPFYPGSGGTSYGYDGLTGNKYNNGIASAYGATYASGNLISVALDMDSGKIWFAKNGVWQASGDPAAGTNAAFTTLSNAVSTVASYGRRSATAANPSGSINFGQRQFVYTPPTGFKSLNTFNLPPPTIPNGAAQFAATLYTGNGGTQVITNTVNGVSMQPDLVWIKGRSGATNNGLQDSVRGTAGGILVSNSTAAESAGGAYISSLNSNGFTVNANSSGNGSTATYVGWQWKANGTPAVTNTSGSIPSTISANTTSGFSIVTFTCPASGNFTVGHGLGIAPAMFILKTRNGVDGWYVYHKNLATPASNYLVLNTTAATATSTSIWGNTNPTSSVLTLGTNAGIGANLNGLLYCFSEIAGFSKFGGWTGNGSTDGPFIYTGFRPRFILIKDYGNPASNWIIQDTSVNTYNVAANILSSNSSAAETTYTGIDFLSNGFKVRVAGAPINTNGNGVLYAAFAENPFNYSLAR
jgi:hypothetical protein